ncbi:hypothetical protein BJF85_08625 [Saccharomonospora sp. CUA-673]|uniref:hypothetical protein n=1 Tax=Saccharomonospora sp. CUA-673 TaxID=1904969 RepID=UPI000965E8AF|nr:hypothetical protein [Saccharomonospora sp. CUA-673]OLT38732.1 hypothetical protein BJF85_08625 [Saccharomonospora sp. CUA-673]
MSGQYEVEDTDVFDPMEKRLASMSDEVREIGDLVAGMMLDPGLFGVGVGQVIGAAASDACSKTGEALRDYGETIDVHKEKLSNARESYMEQERSVQAAMSEYDL